MSQSLSKLRELLACDFVDYLTFSFQYRGLTPSKSQIEFAEHLQSGDPAVGIMSCRGSSKTTVASIEYVNWRHLRCPHLKVMILSGRADHAEAIARKNFDNYSTFPWLKHLAPRKGTSETSFNLTGAERETTRSITSVSVLGGFTGSRSDLVILDDIQQAKQTSDLRYEQILESVNEVFSVLRDPETRPWYPKPLPELMPERTQRVVVGTYQDLYNDVYTPPADPLVPHFMRGVELRSWPAIVRDDEQGQPFRDDRAGTVMLQGHEGKYLEGRYRSNFPEILTLPYLQQKCDDLPRHRWALEYLLDKTAVPAAHDAVLDLKRITAHAWEDKHLQNEKGHPLVPNWYMVVDPAEKGGDYFVAVEITYWQGKLYVRDIHAWSRLSSEECVEKLIGIAIEKGDIRRIHFESAFSALGSVIKMVKERHGGKANIPHEPIHHREDKLRRTINTLEPGLNSGNMRLRRDLLLRRDVRIQLEGLRQGAMPKDHDDIVDCLGFAYRVFEDKVQRTTRGSITSVIVA